MSKSPRSDLALLEQLKGTLAALTEQARSTPLSTVARRKLDGGAREVMAQLAQLLHELDPIRQPSAIFDPSNPKIVGRFVALALVAQPRHKLAEIERFYGSGVYALYYKGKFPAYKAVSGTETPLYVGQAAPASNARTPMEQGDKLSSRLSEHRKNIERANASLNIDDFECRTLVVQSGWETAAEDYLIHLFSPIWNNETKILYGLGKHGDAAETRGNKRSPWDTLHPGRAWAASNKLVDARTPDEISKDLKAHFSSTRIFKSLDEVLAEFIQELRQL
jgi:hypothetical protein